MVHQLQHQAASAPAPAPAPTQTQAEPKSNTPTLAGSDFEAMCSSEALSQGRGGSRREGDGGGQPEESGKSLRASKVSDRRVPQAKQQ